MEDAENLDFNDEKVADFLKKVMEIESNPSHERGAGRSARRDKIRDLLEKTCS